MHMRNRGMCLLPRRCHRPFSIRLIPIRCLNRVTDPSRQQLQAPIPDMWLRRQRMNAYHIRPLALIHDLSRKTALGPPPGPLRSRSSSAGVLFLLLRALRIWLWLRVAAGVGWILVPNVALFVTEKLFPVKISDDVTASAKQLSSFSLSRRTRGYIRYVRTKSSQYDCSSGYPSECA